MKPDAVHVEEEDAEHRRVTTLRLQAARDDIQMLMLSREICQRTTRIAEASDHVSGSPFFLYWLISQYAQASCIAIRRLTDKDPSTSSLVAVLNRIRSRPGAYRYRFLPSDYRAEGGTTVNPQRVGQDVDELRTVAEKVIQYVNKHLAHLDKAPNMAIPDLAELNKVIDLLGERLHRYELLVTGVDLMLLPVLQFDWTTVFDQPWRTVLTP
ncbi:hypothetical protein QEZ54_20475 [Catellatospora sp. KI3]|uniref:AbiU2 domain-containing protein n=1 Tax=Catellatospora sp. KI3 TaxID=3041620 RepID=UPI002482EDDF|nr:hypothetical protein [Catellatospora sp. KI3]MDI1463362.1 hypothetical protein [Catellatospora sp. KI3]